MERPIVGVFCQLGDCCWCVTSRTSIPHEVVIVSVGTHGWDNEIGTLWLQTIPIMGLSIMM